MHRGAALSYSPRRRHDFTNCQCDTMSLLQHSSACLRTSRFSDSISSITRSFSPSRASTLRPCEWCRANSPTSKHATASVIVSSDESSSVSSRRSGPKSCASIARTFSFQNAVVWHAPHSSSPPSSSRMYSARPVSVAVEPASSTFAFTNAASSFSSASLILRSSCSCCSDGSSFVADTMCRAGPPNSSSPMMFASAAKAMRRIFSRWPERTRRVKAFTAPELISTGLAGSNCDMHHRQKATS
mmetsp:Transcript_20431/g.72268  ORF Transcript_20431/g.72268 Transcript_20431/m.72268 type:complete len:243 (-) Transcript_20431:815-1543(-)